MILSENGFLVEQTLSIQAPVYSDIEDLRSSLGEEPELGSVAFILDTQALYVHTTGCVIVSVHLHSILDCFFDDCVPNIKAKKSMLKKRPNWYASNGGHFERHNVLC